jgi:AAA+ ATPase superfamily predicted ATPase
MNAKIVGRKREQARLADALSSHRSELVAIYGRRRIGKITGAGLFLNCVGSIYL